MEETNRSVLMLARIEAVPFTRWHAKARIIMGTSTFLDAVDALSLAFVLPVLVGAWHIQTREIGLLIGAGYIGQLVGALSFGWLAERQGRIRSAALAIGLMSLMGIVCAFTGSFWMLLTFRVLQGIGLGGEVPVAATYINELSRANGRGRFFMLYELIFPIGLMATGFLGSWVVPTYGWRVMLLIGTIPGLFTAILVSRLPESPRWLINKGRFDEAERVIKQMESSTPLRVPEVIAPRAPVTAAVVETAAPIGPTRGRLRELFSPVYRHRTLIVWGLWATSYFIANGVNNWVPTLYRTIYQLPLGDALKAASVNNVVQVVATIICALIIDAVGRRAFTIVSFLVAAVTFGILATVAGIHIVGVIALVSLGYGMIGATNTLLYLYTPEIYPTRIRAVATSVATAWLRLASAIAPAMVGYVVSTEGIAVMFGIFAAVGIAGAVFAKFMVETRGRTLEQIAP
jgi:MFS transporter, putative metabolite:H+ symporter